MRGVTTSNNVLARGRTSPPLDVVRIIFASPRFLVRRGLFIRCIQVSHSSPDASTNTLSPVVIILDTMFLTKLVFVLRYRMFPFFAEAVVKDTLRIRLSVLISPSNVPIPQAGPTPEGMCNSFVDFLVTFGNEVEIRGFCASGRRWQTTSPCTFGSLLYLRSLRAFTSFSSSPNRHTRVVTDAPLLLEGTTFRTIPIAVASSLILLGDAFKSLVAYAATHLFPEPMLNLCS